MGFLMHAIINGTNATVEVVDGEPYGIGATGKPGCKRLGPCPSDWALSLPSLGLAPWHRCHIRPTGK